MANTEKDVFRMNWTKSYFSTNREAGLINQLTFSSNMLIYWNIFQTSLLKINSFPIFSLGFYPGWRRLAGRHEDGQRREFGQETRRKTDQDSHYVGLKEIFWEIYAK